MNILLFGATGRTGRRILAQALEREDNVTAFARDPSKLNTDHSRLKTVQENVRDGQTISGAICGNKAVLSTLGKLDATQRVSAIENIIAGMQQHGALPFISDIRFRRKRFFTTPRQERAGLRSE